jgi:serine protease Do
LEKGDWILAFGSPFDYVGSMTHGIVSALHRDTHILGNLGYEDFIQVDAPINPGNSGGPLVNLRAEVVGINTAIASHNGGFQGIGFAIPSNQAQEIYKALKEKGKVTRGWLGVEFRDVANDLPKVKSVDFNGTSGIFVETVRAKTPAAGKLQAGDVITELNGKPIDNGQTFRNAIAAMSPGTEVTFKVFRDQKYQDVVVRLGTQPEDMEAAAGEEGLKPEQGPSDTAEAMGMHLSDLNGELATKYGLNDLKGGAVITEIDPRSLAARAGLKIGDDIVRINKQPIASAQEAGEALKKADLHKGVRIVVINNAGTSFVLIKDAGGAEK